MSIEQDAARIACELKAARTPADRKAAIMSLATAFVTHARQQVPESNPGDAVQTFEEAGLASADDGVIVTDGNLGLEFRMTIVDVDPLRLQVDVRATREASEPFAPVLQAVVEFAFKGLGLA